MTTNSKRVWNNPGAFDPRFRKLAKDQNNGQEIYSRQLRAEAVALYALQQPDDIMVGALGTKFCGPPCSTGGGLVYSGTVGPTVDNFISDQYFNAFHSGCCPGYIEHRRAAIKRGETHLFCRMGGSAYRVENKSRQLNFYSPPGAVIPLCHASSASIGTVVIAYVYHDASPATLA